MTKLLQVKGVDGEVSFRLRKLFLLFLVMALALTGGCGTSSNDDSAVENIQGSAASEEPLQLPDDADYSTVDVRSAEEDTALGKKLIHGLDYTISVSDANQVADKIIKEAYDLQGYLVESDLSADNGKSSHAYLVVKIPQNKMQLMADYLESLGTVKNQAVYTEDVTSEYYDTEARIKVLQKEEERMLSFMDNESATIQDLLAIEREIGQVREKRESLQARMNALKNQVVYSQFNIQLQTSSNELATPQGILAKAKAALISSLNFMLKLFNWLVIIFFAILPYLLLLGLAYAAFCLIKKRRSARKERP